MGGTCGTHGGKRNAYVVFVGNPEGRRPIPRSRSRWEYSVKMDVKGICGSVSVGFIWLRTGTGGRLL
jgi:hypothetical protein